MPKQWNTVWAGKEAFTAIDGKGYRHGSLDYTYVRYHRVLWALSHGRWPNGEIDHIDGDRLNNALPNLREATPSQNQKNKIRPKNNTSGHLGVSWYKPYGKWRVWVQVDGRQKHLGYFDALADAVAARSRAEARYGYHENHGRDRTQC